MSTASRRGRSSVGRGRPRSSTTMSGSSPRSTYSTPSSPSRATSTSKPAIMRPRRKVSAEAWSPSTRSTRDGRRLSTRNRSPFGLTTLTFPPKPCFPARRTPKADSSSSSSRRVRLITSLDERQIHTYDSRGDFVKIRQSAPEKRGNNSPSSPMDSEPVSFRGAAPRQLSGSENRYSTTGTSIPSWYRSVFKSPWCCRS